MKKLLIKVNLYEITMPTEKFKANIYQAIVENKKMQVFGLWFLVPKTKAPVTLTEQKCHCFLGNKMMLKMSHAEPFGDSV